MNLISWVRERLGINDVAGWKRVLGGSTWAGKPVTWDNSLQLSTWWRAVKLYAEVTGTTPIKFYERTKDGGRRQLGPGDHPIAAIVSADPNIDQTTQEFWGAQAAASSFGNAYAEKRFSVIGSSRWSRCHSTPARIATRMAISITATSTAAKPTSGCRPPRCSTPAALASAATLWVVAAAVRAAGLEPRARDRRGDRQDLRQGHAFVGFLHRPEPSDRSSARTSRRPSSIRSSATTPKRTTASWRTASTSSRSTSPPKDAEMLLSRRFNVEEICRFMGVPPILVGHAGEGQTMWGTGVECIIVAVADARPRRVPVQHREVDQQAAAARRRSGQRYYAEFDRNAMLRADSKARPSVFEADSRTRG
jgi:hypothetical protein